MPVCRLIGYCVPRFKLKVRNCYYHQGTRRVLVSNICAALLLLNLLKNVSCCSLLAFEFVLEAVHLLLYCLLQCLYCHYISFSFGQYCY